MSGKKHDEGKARYDLIPVAPLEGIAQVFAYGAKKYGDRNWEKGIATSRLYAAALRHLTAWWSGEDCDDESGASHLAHAMCSIMMLHEMADSWKWMDRPLGQIVRTDYSGSFSMKIETESEGSPDVP